LLDSRDLLQLTGKTAAVFGVANERSIAWAIAKALSGAGANIAFSCESERVLDKVTALAKGLGGTNTVQVCDVANEQHTHEFFKPVEKNFRGLDFLIHSIAFAPRETFGKPFYQTTKEEFFQTLNISAYSLIELTRKALPLMREGGSIVTLTYLAGERAIHNYNVMGTAKAALEQIVRQLSLELGDKGIRINAISQGPTQTLAARGITGFVDMKEFHEKTAPLGGSSAEDAAGVALFLCSGLSRHVTGEVLHNDGGFSILGMQLPKTNKA